MGLCFSKSNLERRVDAQEQWVNSTMQSGGVKQLQGMKGESGGRKYSNRQIKGMLRQNYWNTRESNSYVLDRDVSKAGGFSRYSQDHRIYRA
ncbi:MAG: hypothetical protein ACI9S8_001681 [Chlamydiales bacterium]|jgi:hypothetical protein